MFSEKLRTLRKKAQLSQERLAEILGVSRQAITKWETQTGMPDIENIKTIAELFSISVDELLGIETKRETITDFLYESITYYDIDQPKNYEIRMGGINQMRLTGYQGEKLCIRLASNTLAHLQRDIKLRIDDVRNRIELDIVRKKNITEAMTKENLFAFVQIPQQYLNRIELLLYAKNLDITSLVCDHIEFDGKLSRLSTDADIKTLELNCNIDMEITCHTFSGELQLNQVSSTSKIHVPADADFAVSTKGFGNTLSFTRQGQKSDSFAHPEAENSIELNGLRSELVINQMKGR